MKEFITIAGKIIALLVPITVAALWFDAKFDDQKASADDIKQSIEYINIEQSFMSEDLAGIHDSLTNMEQDNTKQSEDISSIVWILKNQEQFSAEQMEQLIDKMLKKNIGMERIYPEWPNWMTAQPDTDLKREMLE